MKNGFIKNYLRIYGIVLFFISIFYFQGVVAELNLPKGLYPFVSYGTLILSFVSYFGLLVFANQIYSKEEKPNKKN